MDPDGDSLEQWPQAFESSGFERDLRRHSYTLPTYLDNPVLFQLSRKREREREREEAKPRNSSSYSSLKFQSCPTENVPTGRLESEVHRSKWGESVHASCSLGSPVRSL